MSDGVVDRCNGKKIKHYAQESIVQKIFLKIGCTYIINRLLMFYLHCRRYDMIKLSKNVLSTFSPSSPSSPSSSSSLDMADHELGPETASFLVLTSRCVHHLPMLVLVELDSQQFLQK